MIAALVLAGWFVAAVVAALIVGPLLRRNQQRYPLPPAPPEIRIRWDYTATLSPAQEREYERQKDLTVALQPGGLIVSRRA